MKKIATIIFVLACIIAKADTIPQSVMQAVYDEVRTPYKYGLVVAPTDNYHKYDHQYKFRSFHWFLDQHSFGMTKHNQYQ